MKKISLGFLLLLMPLYFFANTKHIKKILFINSYHSGYSWSDGIVKAFEDTINSQKTKYHVKIIEMDTKRNSSELFKQEAALKAKKIIEEYQPDIVVASDDNASKYLIVPYYYNSSLPFIFCGVNYTAKDYNFPSKNVTGMIEVTLIEEAFRILKDHKKSSKIAYLSSLNLSAKKSAMNFEELLNKKIDQYYVKSVKEWKKRFLLLQESANIVFLGSFAPLGDRPDVKKDLFNFVNEHTKIPSISWTKGSRKFSLLTFSHQPEEQGIWAAKTAIRVLKGEKISNIPLSKNKKADIFVNPYLMKKLKISLPFEILENATFLE